MAIESGGREVGQERFEPGHRLRGLARRELGAGQAGQGPERIHVQRQDVGVGDDVVDGVRRGAARLELVGQAARQDPHGRGRVRLDADLGGRVEHAATQLALGVPSFRERRRNERWRWNSSERFLSRRSRMKMPVPSTTEIRMTMPSR